MPVLNWRDSNVTQYLPDVTSGRPCHSSCSLVPLVYGLCLWMQAWRCGCRERWKGAQGACIPQQQKRRAVAAVSSRWAAALQPWWRSPASRCRCPGQGRRSCKILADRRQRTGTFCFLCTWKIPHKSIITWRVSVYQAVQMNALSMQAWNHAFSVTASELCNDLALQVRQAPVHLLYLSLA